jgi:Ni/Co efflux regulator RcnB
LLLSKIKGDEKQMKKKLIVMITALTIALSQLAVSATDYTSSDPNKNSSYNRSSAIWYAGTWVNSINSTYGEAKDQYGSPNDCTNFVSQILKCGSMSELVDSRYSRNTVSAADSIKSWYFTNLTYPNRSTSWTGAHEFRKHWANVNTEGYERAYAMKSWTVSDAKTKLSEIYAYVNNGDILQYSNSSGVTKHSQFVYAKYTTGEIYMAQHTGNGYRWLHEFLNTTPYTYVSAIRIKAGL